MYKVQCHVPSRENFSLCCTTLLTGGIGFFDVELDGVRCELDDRGFLDRADPGGD